MADTNSQPNQIESKAEFLEKMQALQEVTLELSRIADLETLYRRAIELGRDHLGFDRLGLLFYDEANNLMRGAFGTDEQGNLRDERGFHESLDDPRLLAVLHSQEGFGYWPEIDLKDYGQVIGQGWNAMAVLWSGEKSIGWLAADNLIHRQPFTYHLDILKLYGVTLGHLITQKQSEESRRRSSRALLDSLLDSIPDLIFYKDVAGVYLGCNTAFAEFAGRTVADIVGKTDFDMFSDDVAAFFREQDAEMMAQGQARQNEEWVDYPDGRRVLLDTLKTPFYDADKNLLGLIGISRDITAAYHAQEEARRLSYVVAQSLDGTAVADLDGVVQFVNPAWAAMHGYTVAELIGQHLSIFHTPAQLAQEVEPINQQAIATGQPQRAEIGHVRRDGVTFPTLMTISLLKDDAGNPIGLTASAQDITERKAAEEALRQSEERARNILENANEIIYTLTPDGIFRFVSPAWTELLGHPVAQVENHPFIPFVHPEDVPACVAFLERIVTTGQSQRGVEYRVRHVDGSWRWHSSNGSAVKDDQGNVLYYVGLAQDVTEQKAGREALQESQARLIQANQVVENSPVILFRWRADEHWTVEYVSENIARFGYTPGELLSGETPYATIVHPDDLARVAQEVGDYSAAGVAQFTQEYRILTKDGQVRWTDDRTVIIRDEAGNITHYQGIVIDITERKEVEAKLAQQALDLQTVADLTATVRSTLHDQQGLLQQVVDLTQRRFNLYHAHVYLLDAAGQYLVLAAGAGEVGRAMIAEGQRIPVAQEKSLVARAARRRQSVISHDVQTEPGFLPHPLLPETRSEMAVPLISGQTVLGVLDVQAAQPHYFSEESANIQTTLAAQIAIALENARLLAESQQAVAELDALNRRLTRESWESYLQSFDEQEIGFSYDYGRLAPLETPLELVQEVVGPQNGETEAGLLARALMVHGEAIGRLALYHDEADMALEAAEMEAIITAVADQLSARIENIRLTDQTQAALALTENLYQAGRRLNTSSENLQEALAAVAEAAPIAAVDRLVLFLTEYHASGQPIAIRHVAGWHSGKGNPPPAPGTRYTLEMLQNLEAFRSRNMTIINDTANDERLSPLLTFQFQQLHTPAVTVLPLWVGDRNLGVLLLETSEPYQFHEAELEPYESLAGQLAIAIDRQRLLREAEMRAERERQIRTITDKIRRGGDREAILRLAREEIGQLLGAKTAVGQLGTPAQLVAHWQKAAGADQEKNGRAQTAPSPEAESER